jgi:hypothetical protein
MIVVGLADFTRLEVMNLFHGRKMASSNKILAISAEFSVLLCPIDDQATGRQ